MKGQIVAYRNHIPKKSHRRQKQLDNIALVPAGELPVLQQWQERARSLPSATTLIVISANDPKLREVGRLIAQTLKHRGQRALIATIQHSGVS